jgi:hypothetical protein
MEMQPAPQWQSRNIVQALRAPQQQIGVREEPTLKIEGLGQSPMMSAAGAQQAGNDFGSMLKDGFNMFKNTDTGKDMMGSISSIFGGSSGADIGRAASQYGPEVAKMGGNVGITSGGTATTGSGMFGGSSAGGMSGAMSAAGPIIGAVLGGLKVDDLLNESDKDKWYNADKINSYGTFNVGGKDVGLRGGDFINGINPATWLSDPNKAQKGLLNAFTLGIFD